jgi:agmatinase
MFNTLKILQVKKIVQVGIRDWCEEEQYIIQFSNGRIKTFFDFQLKEQLFRSKGWASICSDIVQELPKHVYISFDIDGLDPKLCPNTGTPVPGGLEFEQVIFLLEMLARSGKKIIGFDLSEVSPGKDQWDGNVGARILYRICNFMAVSNGLAKWSR